jgi:uncharacterized protein with WD repeat
VLADQTASFYNMVANSAGDPETPYRLEQDPSRPIYPEVTICRFSPKHGHLAAIASRHGLFVYDVENKIELMLLVQLDIQALEWSPCDNYIICCEKFNNATPQPNLFIFAAKTGKALAKFEWRKNPQEAMRSIKFSSDESHCFRLVP